jgi:site-specific DNA-methyltransferase (adenine-specific)/modification methylase
MDILPTLDKVDAVITDPPYGIGKRSGTISKERNKNNYISFEDTSENIKNNIVPRFEFALKKASRALITPGGKCFSFYPAPKDLGMIYQPAAVGMTHWGRTTCQPIYFYGNDPKVGKTIKPIHYILTESPEKNGHPCPKPINFMKWCVDRVSLNNETILDPFMGSGTTGVAAIQMGRKFIGIEREPKYFDIACKRIEQATRQDDMFIKHSKPEQVALL